jgi:hypothetical protein
MMNLIEKCLAFLRRYLKFISCFGKKVEIKLVCIYWNVTENFTFSVLLSVASSRRTERTGNVNLLFRYSVASVASYPGPFRCQFHDTWQPSSYTFLVCLIISVFVQELNNCALCLRGPVFKSHSVNCLSYWGFSLFFHTFQANALNKATTASIHILFNSLFTNHYSTLYSLSYWNLR